MDYEAGGAVDATTPGRLGLAAPAEGQALGWPPSVTYDIEGFSPVISLQVAARAARYAEGSRAIGEEARRGARHTTSIRARASLTPSFNLVVALALGVVVFACITYLMTGGNLLLPFPLPA
jgi:hypothetical protein